MDTEPLSEFFFWILALVRTFCLTTPPPGQNSCKSQVDPRGLWRSHYQCSFFRQGRFAGTKKKSIPVSQMPRVRFSYSSDIWFPSFLRSLDSIGQTPSPHLKTNHASCIVPCLQHHCLRSNLLRFLPIRCTFLDDDPRPA